MHLSLIMFKKKLISFFKPICQSQLAAARQRNESNSVFTRNRFRIRRDRILEDAYDQMSALSEDDLRGPVMHLFLFVYIQ